MAGNKRVFLRLFGWLKPEHKALLLAHHSPKGYAKRTTAVKFFGVSARVCSRCLGTYAALAACLLLVISFFGTQIIGKWPLLPFALALPLAALIDWAISRVDRNFGNSFFRVASGFLLGVGYFAWLALFLENPLNVLLWFSAIVYSSAALIVLVLTPNGAGELLYT